MKKVNILISAFLISAGISAQSVYDVILQAKALSSSGKADDAISILSGAMKNWNDYRLFREKADNEVVNGDLASAVSDYNAANKLVEYSGETGLARVYAIRGDAAASLSHLELSMKSRFKKSEKEIMLDPAFGKIENSPDWRSFWKKDWYTASDEALSEIEYYVSSGRIIEAGDVYSGMEKASAGRNDLIYAGALIDEGSGNNDEAVKSLTSLLASDPKNEKYLRALASAQAGNSNPAGASVTYTRLIALEVPDAGLFLMRAGCYRQTGEYDKAMKDITRYLALYPGNKTALRMAGKVESASGRNLKALEYFSMNLKLHPDDPQCYIDRGDSYFLSKSWDWAAKDYGMSLDLDPGNPDVWLNRGIALVNEGNTDDACHDFRMSLRYGNKKATDYISKYCIK